MQIPLGERWTPRGGPAADLFRGFDQVLEGDHTDAVISLPQRASDRRDGGWSRGVIRRAHDDHRTLAHASDLKARRQQQVPPQLVRAGGFQSVTGNNRIFEPGTR